MRKSIILIIVILTISVIFIISQNIDGKSTNNIDKTTNTINKYGFVTNEGIINGLYQDLDLNDTKQVFRYIFSRLEDKVVMYPTENYYYFTFTAKGKNMGGSLSLFADTRDKGLIDLGYSEKRDKFENVNFSTLVGGGANFTEKDGVIVKKIDSFNYSVTFEGKTVIFRLNDVGLSPPKNLHDGEIFVGPSFDESGLKFFLIFNNSEKKLFWVLNEDGFVPEDFENYTDKIVIGKRTEFAFYIDEDKNKNSRKILIGVNGPNVLQNTWYDGPFDQMPDNYVYTGQIEVKKYLEAAYPDIAGNIDKYGNYLDEEGARIAVAPYLVYFAKSDLENVTKSCLGATLFYSCITEQKYMVPESYYEGMGILPPMPPGMENLTNYSSENYTEETK